MPQEKEKYNENLDVVLYEQFDCFIGDVFVDGLGKDGAFSYAYRGARVC